MTKRYTLQQMGSHWIIALFWVVCVHGEIGFDLNAFGEKCLSEHIGLGELVSGSFEIEPSSRTQNIVEVSVRTKDTSSVVYSVSSQKSGKFSFTAENEGEHEFCFKNTDSDSAGITLEIRLGVDAIDFAKVSEFDAIELIERQLRHLEDSVTNVHDRMLQMREREEEMRNTNESTNARVLWFSMFSIVVLVSLSLWQAWYIKAFFRKKKVI